MLFLKDGPIVKLQRFFDRQEAGLLLANQLKNLRTFGKDLIVCTIPRGGIVVGAEIAKALNAKLTVLPIKKIGAPSNPELAIGAVGPTGAPFLDKPLISVLQISKSTLQGEIKEAKAEVRRRMREYGVAKQNFKNKVVILTDDGIATGATMNLAAKIIASSKPAKLILAIPVAPASKINQLRQEFDEVLVIFAPEDFTAVGQFYQNFPQVTDGEVKQLLADANR